MTPRLKSPLLWVPVLALLLVLLLGPRLSVPALEPQPATATATATPHPQTIERGLYLARVGNCALCHTARGGAPFAGGRPVDTPFGTVYSSNITPDPHFGIGTWNAAEFKRAMRHGVGRDDRRLVPAFPYTSYTRLSNDDIQALWAYLQTVAPSQQANQEHALPWPLNTQAALWAWQLLNFAPGDQAFERLAAMPAEAKVEPAQWQRGAYLTLGLGHCMECHSERNAMGGIRHAGRGSELPGSRWLAPSLLDRSQASVADWSDAEVVDFLVRGISARGQASGPMAEVVLHGTQHLHPDDALAMARYLRHLPQDGADKAPAKIVASQASSSQTPNTTPVAIASGLNADSLGATFRLGNALYDKHCASCHGEQGEGVSGVYPALAGNRLVNMAHTQNLGLIVLRGGFAPATQGNPQPYGMPPFQLSLSDAETAAVLSYTRQAWGNTGGAVTEFDINKIRR